MPSTLRLDIFNEFTYDVRLRRYRVSTGVGAGQFISKQAFIASTQRYLDAQQNLLISLADDLGDGRLQLKDFQRRAAEILREIHTSQAILGANGIENLNSSDWLRVGRQLKRQYYAGIDTESGRRFGLKYLAQDIANGRLSLAEIRNRLSLYAESGKLTYYETEGAKNEKPLVKRVLGAAEHCQECLDYASMGIRPKGELPYPTERCSCKMRCKCSMLYLSLEEAISQGYQA
jgi:hypothetical protein